MTHVKGSFCHIVSAQMTQQSFNEVVVDARVYRQNLPHSLEAILGDRETYDAFLKHYKLSSGDIPLVQFGGNGFVAI